MNRPLRPWVQKAITVIIASFLGAFAFTGFAGLEARLQAVEDRPIVVQSYESIATPSATLTPTASISATPSVRIIRTVKPTQ